MKIIPLSEGSFTIDQTKIFVPFDKSVDTLQQRSSGSLLVEIQPFAVVTNKDVLVLDSGLGHLDKNGNMQIHQNLRSNGIDPSQVTKVLMSHLHKDHAGGLMNNNKAAFPNATYYINGSELEYAFQKGMPSYDLPRIEHLKESVNLSILNDGGRIDEYIQYEMSGAHCPYHMVFAIHENDDTLFFGGDVAPQLQQMKTRYVAKYDFEPKKSMELRTKWWKEGKEGHWTFLFYHDIKAPFVRL